MAFEFGDRQLGTEDDLCLTSVGVDIGSSTSHLVFSTLRLERAEGRYVTVERTVWHESAVLLTPFTSEDLAVIDAGALGEFIEGEYESLGMARNDIDTGALILTGLAVRKDNARRIGELFAEDAGRFVTVIAGDELEAVMAAYGSGAVDVAREEVCLNIDIGGGTTKFALCAGGRVKETSAIDVGARLILCDSSDVVTRLEEPGGYLSGRLGVGIKVGERADDEGLAKIVSLMADCIIEIADDAKKLSDETQHLLRLPPLSHADRIEVITFSGGVSEYLYGREDGAYGDLGKLLAGAIRERVGQLGAPVHAASQGLRATALGASQHTVQVSGSTIFLSSADVVPLRNVPVITPWFDLEADAVSSVVIEEAVRGAIHRARALEMDCGVAIALTWRGPATYSRLQALAWGLVRGLQEVVGQGHPVVLVSEGDVGGLLGIHVRDALGGRAPVVSVDGIELREFDYVDVGSVVPLSGAVPVVIKTLVFPGGGDHGNG